MTLVPLPGVSLRCPDSQGATRGLGPAAFPGLAKTGEPARAVAHDITIETTSK